MNSIERGIFTINYTGRKAKFPGGRRSEWMSVGAGKPAKVLKGPKGPREY
jgi:hypothetical protein